MSTNRRIIICDDEYFICPYCLDDNKLSVDYIIQDYCRYMVDNDDDYDRDNSFWVYCNECGNLPLLDIFNQRPIKKDEVITMLKDRGFTFPTLIHGNQHVTDINHMKTFIEIYSCTADIAFESNENIDDDDIVDAINNDEEIPYKDIITIEYNPIPSPSEYYYYYRCISSVNNKKFWCILWGD